MSVAGFGSLRAMPKPSAIARVARWCFTHRAATVALWVILAVLVSVLGASAGTKKASSFRLPGTESQRAYELLQQHFPAQTGDTDQIVFRAKTGTLRDAANRAAVDKTLKAVAAKPGVAAVSSPLVTGGKLTPDAKIGVGLLRYDGTVGDDVEQKQLKTIQDAVLAGETSTLQVEHGGQGAEFARQGGGNATEFIGVLAALVVLLVTFGSLVAAFAPLLSAILAIVTTLGGIKLLSHVVDTPDFATQLATLIGLGVGIDYALFVLTRYRAELATHARVDAVERAIDTAGRTVCFAACTVVIALLGLLLLGLNFLQGVALGAALSVLLTMGAALTLLPAFLGIAGSRINSRRARKRLVAVEAGEREPKQEGAGWARWSRFVQRRPWPVAAVALVILLGLTAPVLGLRLGSSDASVDPPDTTTYKAYQLIADGFGPGVSGTFLVAVELPRKGDRAAAKQVAAAIGRDPGVAAAAAPTLSPDGVVATITAVPKTGPQDQATTDTLNRLRDDVVPPAERASGATVEIGGITASQEDFTGVIANKLPLFVGVVVLLSALLLLAVFRSVLIPVKAAVMNLLSIGAALGVVTLIFQNGVGAGLLGIETGPIESFLPVLLFSIVFGLSMDYEVFLVSRIHEEWEKSRDASGSVVAGLATTGKVITAAAAIMVLVFASFGIAPDRVIKLFGLGLASAVFLDAVVIRCLLVPAIMELMGRRAWWLPGWLDRLVPSVALEAPAETRPEPA